MIIAIIFGYFVDFIAGPGPGGIIAAVIIMGIFGGDDKENNEKQENKTIIKQE
jgi:hypothetical protein